jgi:hypothetical protein
MNNLSDEAKVIVKQLKKHPNAHIHYFADRMWSMYADKKIFEKYWEKGDGDKDLSEIEIMQGDDFDSTYCPPLTEALMYLNGKTTSSI